MAQPQGIGLGGRKTDADDGQGEKRGSGGRAGQAAPPANAQPTGRQTFGHENREGEDVERIAPPGRRTLARTQDGLTMRYRCVSLRMKNDPSATAIDASVAPSSEAVASLTNALPGAIAVAMPSSFKK
jgi:hypothetical protein